MSSSLINFQLISAFFAFYVLNFDLIHRIDIIYDTHFTAYTILFTTLEYKIKEKIAFSSNIYFEKYQRVKIESQFKHLNEIITKNWYFTSKF